MLDIEALAIADVKLVSPRRFTDGRGYFSETFNRKRWRDAGIDCDFCQDNESLSAAAGTIRGLHFQAPPYAQAKLVRVLSGAIRDVAVDARRGSPTFGNHVSVDLSAESGLQVFIPAGFLHGFVTLEPNTIVAYKVDAHYDKASEGSVRWNDPDLAIDWGVDERSAVLSEKDAAAPSWAALQTPFSCA